MNKNFIYISIVALVVSVVAFSVSLSRTVVVPDNKVNIGASEDGETGFNSVSINGIAQKWTTGSCADATTTAFSVANPWGADATVDMAFIELTSGTTTITFDVGTSSTAYAAPSEAFMDDVSVSTSTVIRTINTNGALSATYGFTDPSTNSQEYVLWKSGEYINMTVTEPGSTGGVTNAANTFSCTYKIHSFR